MALNQIQRLVQNTIAPLGVVLSTDYGCLVTVQRATEANELDAQAARTFADDGALTNVPAFLLDPEAATKRRIYGLVEGSTMMLLLARVGGAQPVVNTLDRVRVESGPYQGVLFQADTKGNNGAGVFVAVPLSEVV